VQAQAGDAVLLAHGLDPGTVEAVLESPKDIENWNLDERDLMVRSQQTGLVFLPARCLDESEIRFVSRVIPGTEA
jgi:hypothetical protein